MPEMNPVINLDGNIAMGGMGGGVVSSKKNVATDFEEEAYRPNAGTFKEVLNKEDQAEVKITSEGERGSESKEEFVKRTAFALMAALAVHDKKAEDEDFIKFFPLIKKATTDERNFVRKAVNWALRQIGKRNKSLNARTIKLAEEILKLESKSARWIANDAIRELTSEKIKIKL